MRVVSHPGGASRAGAHPGREGWSADLPGLGYIGSRDCPCRQGPSTTNVRRYTLGPSIEIGLPFRFRIEADVLYRRFSRTESFESIGRIDRLSGNDWQFPLLLKFQDSRGRLKPFVSAGAALRHVWGLQGSTESFSLRPVIPPSVSRYPVSAEKNIQAGLVFAGGVRYRMGLIAVLPEIRYTRWTSISLQPGRHQLEFLLGLAR